MIDVKTKKAMYDLIFFAALALAFSAESLCGLFMKAV